MYKANTSKTSPKKSVQATKFDELRKWILDINKRFGVEDKAGAYRTLEALPEDTTIMLTFELQNLFKRLGFGMGDFFVSRMQGGGYRMNSQSMARLGFGPMDFGETAFQMMMRSDAFGLGHAKPTRVAGVRRKPVPVTLTTLPDVKPNTSAIHIPYGTDTNLFRTRRVYAPNNKVHMVRGSSGAQSRGALPDNIYQEFW